MPPTVFLGLRADEGPWTARDRELAKALELDDQSKCPNCGTRHGEKDLSVEQEHCRGCELLHNATSASEDKPGTKYRLVSIDQMER